MRMWRTAGVALIAIVIAGCSGGEAADPSPTPTDSPEVVATESAPAETPSAVPSATPEAAPAPDAGAATGDDLTEFCGLVGRARELDAEIGPFADAFVARSSVATADDDTAAVEAARDFGQAMLDTLPEAIDVYDQAAELVDDPEVLEGLEFSSMLNREVSTPFATQLSEADSLSDVSEATTNFEAAITELTADYDPASVLTLNTYSLDNCGFTLREV